MILQPQQSGARTGRVTEAERAAVRGHAGLAILLPPASLELAWHLERRLFDRGYAVHVIEHPEHLRQAVTTAVEAGLIAIVSPAGEDDRRAVRSAVRPAQIAEIAPAGNTDEAARLAIQELEHSDRLGPLQGPRTGGAGI